MDCSFYWLSKIELNILYYRPIWISSNPNPKGLTNIALVITQFNSTILNTAGFLYCCIDGMVRLDLQFMKTEVLRLSTVSNSGNTS